MPKAKSSRGFRALSPQMVFQLQIALLSQDDLRAWAGPYDPEHFDLEAVNGCLQPRKA
jgi:hypothetical protein